MSYRTKRRPRDPLLPNPPRRADWHAVREAAETPNCEVCGATLVLVTHDPPRDPEVVQVPYAVDHILPERWVRYNQWGNPHARENLICICASCHANKTREAEVHLRRADFVGFCRDLNALGWPMDRLKAALVYYKAWDANRALPFAAQS